MTEIEEMGGRRMAERFADRTVEWKQIKPELRRIVKEEVEGRQFRKTQDLKKGQEEDKQPWQKDWRVARDSLTTPDVEYVEKARTGGLAVEMETGRWDKVRQDKRRCTHCNARNGTAEHASERCCEFDDERAEVKLKLRELGLADTSPWGVVIKGGTEFTRRRSGRQFCAR